MDAKGPSGIYLEDQEGQRWLLGVGGHSGEWGGGPSREDWMVGGDSVRQCGETNHRDPGSQAEELGPGRQDREADEHKVELNDLGLF